MVEKVACTKCGVLILPITEAKNNGLCMPCKTGNRESIENSKLYYQKERELDKTCPFRAAWRELVDKVYNQPKGFNGLSEDEKIYFALNVLNGEIFNGGFTQFFDNSSGEFYLYAELGLIRVGATNSLAILRAAKKEIFGEAEVPKDHEKREAFMRSIKCEDTLDKMDDEYYKDLDDIGNKMDSFGIETGVVKNA